MEFIIEDSLQLPGYEMVEELEANRLWHFYRARHCTTYQEVFIKTLNQERVNTLDLAAATHEFNLLKTCAMKGTLIPISLEKYWNRPVLVSEAFPCRSLRSLMNGQPVPIRVFLKIANKLTWIVDELHRHNLTHKSLQPENILIHLQTGEVKLTGFYHASRIKSENHQSHVNPYTLGSQLAYISPEQSGRINRFLDYRTDLYSLGVVFFEMLTGSLPFDPKDPNEFVHALIAKLPVPIIQVNPTLPSVVSDIIMKLLEKTPEQRYQSASALRSDLIRFETLYSKQCLSPAFPIAERDIPQTFESGGRLYGRKAELETLVESFSHVCEGQSSLVLIPGNSGIGKTALVNKVQQPLVEQKGYFISGKFDLLKQDVPYAPLVHAFQDLLKQISAEGKERVQYWKNHLETELGPYIPVLATILPEVRWMTDSTEETETDGLTPLETNNRIRFAFLQFLHVFAKREHPLVLFLDDVQWADHATLDLLQYLLSQASTRHVLVIAAYRDNEMDGTHPFHVMVRDLTTEISVKTIPLYPLTLQDLRKWVQDTLTSDEEDTIELAAYLEKTTSGNPFFINQLFQTFSERKLLAYDEDKMKWTCDYERLFQLDIHDDILSFITERFTQLPLETQKLLQLAACIGNQFDIHVLSAVFEQPITSTADALWQAIEEGLILPLSPSYKWIHGNDSLLSDNNAVLRFRFLHDRVQQAVYSTMDSVLIESNHLKIGKLLVTYWERQERLLDNIFELVHHLNLCRDVLSEKERIRLAEWNAIAGEKAKKGAAFKSSLSFLKIAKELLANRDAWDLHTDLMTKVTIGLGEAEYLDNRFAEAEKRFDEALAHVKSKKEQLMIYNLKITLYIHVHRVEEAVSCGLKALQLFGWNLNKKPGKLTVAKEFLLTKFLLKNRKATDLMTLPDMKVESHRLIIRTLVNLNAPAYHVDQNLASLLMLRAFNFSLKVGKTDLTALVFNNYSLILSAGFHQYQASYEYGNLAIEYAEETMNNHLLGRVYFVYGSFVNHWKQPIKENQQHLEHAQKRCIESGNAHLAGAASSFICIASFLKGHDLNETEQTIRDQLQFTNQIQFNLSKFFLNDLDYWIQILKGAIETPDWTPVEMTDDTSAKIVHYTIRLQLTYVLNEQTTAMELMEELDRLVDSSLVLLIAPEYYFYADLWMTRLYEKADVKGKARILNRLRKHLSIWKKWAKQAPTNYMHKYRLVQAEVARMQRKVSKAALYYDQSISSAQKNGYIQDTAIANECAGRFHLSRGFSTFAHVYLQSAHSAYESWGAFRKAKELRSEFPDLFSTAFQPLRPNHLTIDKATMLKAAQAISEEIVLDNLVSRLLNILIENGGARKGILFFMVNNQLKPIAVGHVDDPDIKQVSDKEVVEYPSNMIDFIERTREPIIAGWDEATKVYVRDDYMRMHKPKSVLCIPILYQGELIGGLFLENNLMPNAFTEDRLAILNFLSSQAAISLINAFLYQELEKKVQERTALLENANSQLELANVELAEAEEQRKKFLSDISHDLRTPITSIQGYIEGILDGVIDSVEDQTLYLQRSHQRLLTMQRFIDDLFELAKIDAHGLSFDMEYVPSNQLFDHLITRFEDDIKRANLSFSAHLSEPAPTGPYPLIQVDIRRMEQVVQNLVFNAIAFTDKGGISLHHIVDGTRKMAVFIVKDTGIGISKNDLPFLFDRFYTKSRNRKDGHGLGLAICKEIVNFHSGNIVVESVEGLGSSFTIYLPIFE